MPRKRKRLMFGFLILFFGAFMLFNPALVIAVPVLALTAGSLVSFAAYKSAKRPWLLITGVYLLCFCIHIITAGQGNGYFSLGFIGAVVLILPAVSVMASRDGNLRRYLPAAYFALWGGVFLIFKDITVFHGNVVMLFFLCMAGGCFTLYIQRWQRFGKRLKILGLAFAVMGLLCLNDLWLFSLFTANLQILFSAVLIVFAMIIFFTSVKSK